MERYIEISKLPNFEVTLSDGKKYVLLPFEHLYDIPAADVVEVIRCKDCEYHHWEQEPCHGKTIHKCSILNAEVFKDFYCYHGKMKGGE